jgi:hypothetical protein
MKAQGAAWDVPICLDVEGGIRASGPWVPSWLATSGAGLYGNPPVHPGMTAAFHVLAAYPGYDPNASWSGSRPASPCGWQFQGTHGEFGVSVDRGWYDDWFGNLFSAGSGSLGEDMTPEQAAQLTEVLNGVRDANEGLFYGLGTPNPSNAFSKLFEARVAAIVKAELDKLPSTATGGLTGAQDGLLSAIGGDVATVKRLIEKDLAP